MIADDSDEIVEHDDLLHARQLFRAICIDMFHLAAENRTMSKRRELVHVGDKAVDERFSEPVLTPAKITVADIATISVTPAIAGAGEYENKRRKLDDDQRKLLRKAGVASLADATAAMAQRLEFGSAAPGSTRRDLGVAGDDASGVIAKLTQQIANAGAAIQDALSQAQLTELPDIASLEAEQADSRDS
jgi:hypothetical protein